MTDDDNREHSRVTVNKEFESIDAFVSEYVTNISQSGVFIRSKNPLPVGTLVNLKFTILTDDFQIIEGVGRVVRVDTTPHQSGMGVVFTELAPKSRAIVDQLTASPRPSEVAGDPSSPAPTPASSKDKD
jgi:uncharacterized protein (TIGR02266 family)